MESVEMATHYRGLSLTTDALLVGWAAIRTDASPVRPKPPGVLVGTITTEPSAATCALSSPGRARLS